MYLNGKLPDAALRIAPVAAALHFAPSFAALGAGHAHHGFEVGRFSAAARACFRRARRGVRRYRHQPASGLVPISPNTTPSAPKASARSGGETSDFEPVVCMSRTQCRKRGREV